MKNMSVLLLKPALWLGLFCGLYLSVKAQDGPDLSEKYLTPPDPVTEEVLAPRHQNITLDNLNPERRFFLNRQQDGLSPLSYYAKPFYNLAGLQIDWQANRHRSITTQRATAGLELIGARDGAKQDIDTPENATITHPHWSADGTQLAWFAHFDDKTHIYVTDLETRRSVRITPRPVLATLNTKFEWSADGRHIFAVLIPENRGDEPSEPVVPDELQVRKTSDQENRLRTYPSLLESRHEADLLEYYATGQLVRIDVRKRRIHRIGEPAMIRNIDVNPLGEYVIVQTLQKPFSRIVPVSRFGWREEIWGLDGNVLTELRRSEAREGIPDHDELENYDRRNIKWRPDGKGLSLLLQAGKDKKKEGNNDKKTDRVMQWLPPFGENDLNVVYESERKMRSVSYSDEADMLFITERYSGDEHLYIVFTDEPDTTYTIYRHDRDKFYKDPGNLIHTAGSLGVSVVRLTPDKQQAFLSGTQYYKNFEEKAPRPFIDRVEIRSGEKERIFQSSEEAYEQVTAVLDDQIREVVLERQSADIHPDSWLYNIETGEKNKLTTNVDYNKAVTQTQRKRFKVKRADGFEFWVDIVLPADWDGERLPGLIWHYPREYNDQKDYNKSLRRYNKNSYPSVGTRSPEVLVKQGYAVIHSDWPIVGDRGSSNDNFVWSIIQNCTAVIDSADSRGYIDRNRLAIGGHSYGAFGTANAMIHTSFFKAGIAGDGNFNRTLTPMGFQHESSDLWRGRDRYLQMSPIFWADRLDGALLMYHGEADQNVGTWPTNSRRMFHALNSIGKTAVMYMYPYEGHGPAAKETLLDLWRRWVDWLDHHVKGKEDRASELRLAGEE